MIEKFLSGTKTEYYLVEEWTPWMSALRCRQCGRVTTSGTGGVCVKCGFSGEFQEGAVRSLWREEHWRVRDRHGKVKDSGRTYGGKDLILESEFVPSPEPTAAPPREAVFICDRCGAPNKVEVSSDRRVDA